MAKDAKHYSGFTWMLRKHIAIGVQREDAEILAIREIRSQFTTDAEFANTQLFQDMAEHFGGFDKMNEAIKRACG